MRLCYESCKARNNSSLIQSVGGVVFFVLRREGYVFCTAQRDPSPALGSTRVLLLLSVRVPLLAHPRARTVTESHPRARFSFFSHAECECTRAIQCATLENCCRLLSLSFQLIAIISPLICYSFYQRY